MHAQHDLALKAIIYLGDFSLAKKIMGLKNIGHGIPIFTKEEHRVLSSYIVDGLRHKANKSIDLIKSWNDFEAPRSTPKDMSLRVDS